MSISIETPLDNLIEQILDKIIFAINDGKKSGQFKPKKIMFFKWELNDFRYDEKGVVSSSASRKTFEKDDWSSSVVKILDYIKSLDIYQSIKSKILTQYSEIGLHKFNSFIDMFTHKFIYESINFDEVKQSIKSIVDNLNGKPFECGAIVKLMGISLMVESLDLHNGIVLRQPKRMDIEKETPEYIGSERDLDFFNKPSLIMNVSILGRNMVDIQHKIQEAETILQLFTIGSVYYTSYELFSKSFSTSFRGRISSNFTLFPVHIGCIRENDIDRLRQFWDKLKERINLFTRVGEKTTFRHIAYQRYSDALLKNNESLERKISDCMMGFESIFLRDDGEQLELSYRLRLRTARFFGLLGFNPFKIKKMIVDGYEIRSRFVHGGTLDYEGLKKIEEKYESLSSVLNSLLNLLRIAIVVTLLLDIGKSQMIDLIDNSFLSQENEKQLHGMLSNYKDLFVISN